MRMFGKLIGGVVILAATAAIAHEGVQNPAVKARMAAMGVIAENTKVLGTMAKGTLAFDEAAARAAAAAIAEQAALTPGLFEAEEDDPKSEALPAIWANFADFTKKAEDLETAASAAAGSIASLDDVRQAMRGIGGACGGCHKAYRE